MSKSFSIKERIQTSSIVKERDGGFDCFYCGAPLNHQDYVLDHLNNDRNDNRPENLVFACRSCNNKKPYDMDMQLKALKKLRVNEASNLLRERKWSDESAPEMSAEISINVSSSEITEQYVTESITTNGFIEYSDALNSSVFLCKKKTGHGSQQSVRNYIASLTSAVGPFQIVKDENKTKIIVKKSGN